VRRISARTLDAGDFLIYLKFIVFGGRANRDFDLIAAEALEQTLQCREGFHLPQIFPLEELCPLCACPLG
jgi:hypothetical protein